MTTSSARPSIPVTILGATGAVGQTFVRLLANHPWFRISALAASERSAGRAYGEVVRWLEGTLPDEIAEMPVCACDPDKLEAAIAFSALDSGVAGDIEQRFARAGRVVVSNARNHRMDPDVPLLIPEINADHLLLLNGQRTRRGWSGAIVTNPNCAAVVATMALAPLERAFGVARVVMTTMQAISGAGYPGVPSLDILGNVIPFIKDEEEKLRVEPGKILGSLKGDRVEAAKLVVAPSVHRVPVQNGHLVSLAVTLRDPVGPDEARRAMQEWKGDPSACNLPSAPKRALEVMDAEDRPQPRRDVMRGGGMTVTVGRIREDPVMGLAMVALGHNTIRGAAGAAILNAELMVNAGHIPGA